MGQQGNWGTYRVMYYPALPITRSNKAGQPIFKKIIKALVYRYTDALFNEGVSAKITVNWY